MLEYVWLPYSLVLTLSNSIYRNAVCINMLILVNQFSEWNTSISLKASSNWMSCRRLFRINYIVFDYKTLSKCHSGAGLVIKVTERFLHPILECWNQSPPLDPDSSFRIMYIPRKKRWELSPGLLCGCQGLSHVSHLHLLPPTFTQSSSVHCGLSEKCTSERSSLPTLPFYSPSLSLSLSLSLISLKQQQQNINEHGI